MNANSILAAKSSELVITGPHVALVDAASVLARRKIGALPVVDDCGEVIGLLTEREIVYRYAALGPEGLKGEVLSAMSKVLSICGPFDTLQEIARRMTQRQMRHMLVMENNRMVGIISIGDVVKFKIEAAERESEALKTYIMT
jgi:CBS domain-containing protein